MKKIVAVALVVMLLCSAFTCGAGSVKTVRAAETEISLSDIEDTEAFDEAEEAAPVEAEEAEAAQEAAVEEAAQVKDVEKVSESDAQPVISVCDIAVSEPEILKEDDYIEVSTPEELAEAIKTSGKIRLMDDITRNLYIDIYLDITIDLNGHTLTGTGGTVVYLCEYSTLKITDSVGGGKITGGEPPTAVLFMWASQVRLPLKTSPFAATAHRIPAAQFTLMLAMSLLKTAPFATIRQRTAAQWAITTAQAESP